LIRKPSPTKSKAPPVKPQLPDVTLLVVDTVCHELAALAVKDALDRACFGGVVIHTDDVAPFRRILGSADARSDDDLIYFRKIERFASVDAAMTHLWYDAPAPIRTSHALIMQWDAGIVDAGLWSDAFLEYDYIGAPWGWHGDAYEIGNGGFSLRSRRLMDYIAEHRDEFPLGHPEDDVLCRRYRPELERSGFRWAPIDVALRFSFERTGFSGLGAHFGYHGIFNWPRVFSYAALQERTLLALANKYLNHPKHLGELLHAMKVQMADTGAARGDVVPLRRPA
jgi:hypothetical protein